MAWTSPLTWVVGQLVTAAQMNTHIRDNELYLFGQKVEPGTVVDFAGTAVPSGWLLCDGSAVNRVSFGALFAALGTTWGAGDGSTTFNVPDLRGRVTVGAGAGAGLTARTLAAAGGEEAHALSVGELAVHNHGVTESAHNHTQNAHGHTDSGHTHDGHFFVGGNTGSGGATIQIQSGGSQLASTFSAAANIQNQTATNVAASTGLSVNNNGSGTAHNVMQPFGVLTKIIKT